MLLDLERRRSRRAPKARSTPRELGERGNQNCAIRPGLWKLRRGVAYARPRKIHSDAGALKTERLFPNLRLMRTVPSMDCRL